MAKHSFKREDFDAAASSLDNSLKDYPAVLDYIKSNWLTSGHLWSNFGRRFHHADQETNNIVER